MSAPEDDEAAAASAAEKAACEQRLARTLERSPAVRLLLAALTRSGCPLSDSNAWRHLVCEECSPAVEGGFDAQNNQVVICQKRILDDDKAEEVLTHELVHMYDFCTARVDFGNVRHLACTEVRAANLSQRCRFTALGSRLSARAHRECVRERAAESVASIKQGLTRDEARSAVGQVFDRCYADLEPMGRHSWGDRCDRLSLDELQVASRVRSEMAEERSHTDDGLVLRNIESWWAGLTGYWPWRGRGEPKQ